MHDESLYTPGAKVGIDVLARQEVGHEFNKIGTHDRTLLWTMRASTNTLTLDFPIQIAHDI